MRPLRPFVCCFGTFSLQEHHSFVSETALRVKDGWNSLSRQDDRKRHSSCDSRYEIQVLPFGIVGSSQCKRVSVAAVNVMLFGQAK